MAAITKRFLLRRLNIHTFLCPIPYHFSSSYDPDIPQPQTKTQPTFSTNFNEVKASLQNEQQKNRPQNPRKYLSFSNPTPTQTPPSKIAPLEEIRHNLTEFRLRSDGPPPSSSAGQFITFQELLKRNVISTSDDSASYLDFAAKIPVGPAAGGKLSFDAIRENLRQLQATTPVAKNSIGKPIDPMSLTRFNESLKLKASENASDSQMIIGGSGNLSSSIFGKETKGSGDNVGRAVKRTEFMKFYDFVELGKKLEMLRPEKKKGKWFSLQELNERLVKLREIEEKESVGRTGGVTFKDLRESLLTLKLSDDKKARKNTMQRLDILGQLGGTPSFMLSPPQEHLVEKYYLPDHMSSAEKLKLELKKVRDEFKMSESDCGSARVQVAQLTTKIKHLSTVLQKKDKHSRRGLEAMVQRRKKLLKYLRRTDWDSYSMVLSKLGLRDNPVFKA